LIKNRKANTENHFSSLPDAVNWMFDLQKFGIKFGLSSTARLLSALGNPHLKSRYIHLAGTNGKGSVAAMLSAVLTQAGFPVGLYTSPHLVNFNERYRFQDQDISDEAVLDLINQVYRAIDPQELPTFFEFVTAMALLYYSKVKADPIILETGMGGRLDATNIVQPIITVITNIAMDHQEYLGSSLRAIAAEKAGIIKGGVPLVTYTQQQQVTSILQSRCEAVHAPIYYGGVNFCARGQGRGQFDYYGINSEISDLKINLKGRHQYRNAAIALAVIELLREAGYQLPEEAIRLGLLNTRWPGRLELVSAQPRMILDGAHNPAAAAALAEALRKSLTYRRLILVLGIMADKEIKTILKRLLPLAQVIIFTRPRYARAAEPADLARQAGPQEAEIHIVPQLTAAIDQAKSMAGPEDLVVITGSLFTVGEAKEYLTEMEILQGTTPKASEAHQ
jgi:dihydrofolate synthase/folylpolyglutamate synthase